MGLFDGYESFNYFITVQYRGSRDDFVIEWINVNIYVLYCKVVTEYVLQKSNS